MRGSRYVGFLGDGEDKVRSTEFMEWKVREKVDAAG